MSGYSHLVVHQVIAQHVGNFAVGPEGTVGTSVGKMAVTRRGILPLTDNAKFWG